LTELIICNTWKKLTCKGKNAAVTAAAAAAAAVELSITTQV